MPEQKKDREILQILAESLPEKVLLELLPEIKPETIRHILYRLAGVTPPASQPQQQTIFSSCSHSSRTDADCTLYTDGASRGNPGEAGAGAVLVDPDGSERGNRSLYLGQCTNNVAEYQALIAGLELARECGCKELHICLDSELIVRQIQGKYKVKNEYLKPLFEKVNCYLKKFEKWDIRHVPRKDNARADELANMGIDNKE